MEVNIPDRGKSTAIGDVAVMMLEIVVDATAFRGNWESSSSFRRLNSVAAMMEETAGTISAGRVEIVAPKKDKKLL